MALKLSEEEEVALVIKITTWIQNGEAQRVEVEEGHTPGVNELRFSLPVGPLVAGVVREVGAPVGLILRGPKGRVMLRVHGDAGAGQWTRNLEDLPTIGVYSGSIAEPVGSEATTVSAIAELQRTAEEVAAPAEALWEARTAVIRQLNQSEDDIRAREAADLIFGVNSFDLGAEQASLDEFYFGNVEVAGLPAEEGADLLFAVAKDFLTVDELEKLRRGVVMFAATHPEDLEQLIPVMDVLKGRIEQADLSQGAQGLTGVPAQLRATTADVYQELRAGLGMGVGAVREL